MKGAPPFLLTTRMAFTNLCLIFCLAAVTLWNTIDLRNTDGQACGRHNQIIDVIIQNLTTAYLGPHHFNDPADKALRKEVYLTQTNQLRNTRCGREHQ